MTFAGCASDKRVKDAGADIGKAAARVNLPPMPDECYVDEPLGDLTEGAEMVSLLKDSRRHTVRANQKRQRCVKFHDDSATKLKGAG